MGKIPPAENHPLYEDWQIAHDRLVQARKYLDSLSCLPEGDPILLNAHAEWMGAKIVYEAVCAKID